MSDKICPLLTMMGMNKENEDHIIFDYEEPCMGEKCAWYDKCFPEPVYTYSYQSPMHVILDPPDPYTWQGAGYNNSEGVRTTG